MAYLNQGASLGAGIGTPSPAPGAGSIGAPPPPIPSTEPPPYDVLQDPAWSGLVGPQNHALRAFINELSPEHRQMLLNEFMKHKAQGMLNAPPRMPPAVVPGPPQVSSPIPPNI